MWTLILAGSLQAASSDAMIVSRRIGGFNGNAPKVVIGSTGAVQPDTWDRPLHFAR
jgi:hypothetical protein